MKKNLFEDVKVIFDSLYYDEGADFSNRKLFENDKIDDKLNKSLIFKARNLACEFYSLFSKCPYRDSGEEYFFHPLRVAFLYKKIMNLIYNEQPELFNEELFQNITNNVVIALFHDIFEDCYDKNLTFIQRADLFSLTLARRFGSELSEKDTKRIINGIGFMSNNIEDRKVIESLDSETTYVHTIKEKKEKYIKEKLEKASHISLSILLIKILDRLDNLSTTHGLSPERYTRTVLGNEYIFDKISLSQSNFPNQSEFDKILLDLINNLSNYIYNKATSMINQPYGRLYVLNSEKQI